MRKLPPLNAIKAFEATARNLSFSKAAIELNVTAGAISQQVKALENILGVTLFKRQNRLILLTEEGQACLPHISMGLDKISEGISALYQYENKRPLTITLTPTFASGWLIPRLSKFKKKHPEIDIRIDATNEVVDLINDDIDIAIRFGSGEFVGLQAEYLRYSTRVFYDNCFIIIEDINHIGKTYLMLSNIDFSLMLIPLKIIFFHVWNLYLQLRLLGNYSGSFFNIRTRPQIVQIICHPATKTFTK